MQVGLHTHENHFLYHIVADHTNPLRTVTTMGLRFLFPLWDSVFKTEQEGGRGGGGLAVPEIAKQFRKTPFVVVSAEKSGNRH